MKISVCGKGGSGKSAITTLLANGIHERGYRVVVIDSDESNSGLHRMLGFESPPVPLLELVGGKKAVKDVLPKTPIARAEHKINVIGRAQISLNDIPVQYIAKRNGFNLLSVGKILQALEGCACPMGVLSREFIKKLVLDNNEVAIVDMEAGVEHFGRGVESGIDAILLVIDPSFESLELAGKVKSMASEIGIRSTRAVLNKVTSKEVAAKLKDELDSRNVEVIGTVFHDPDMLEAGLEGRPLQSSRASHDIEKVIDTLLSGNS